MTVSDIGKSGRPRLPHSRRAGVYVRFSDVEIAAIEKALAVEYPVSRRRPPLVAWLRDLAVAHATEVLQLQVTRSGLRDLAGATDWARWRWRRAVRRAVKRRRRSR